MMERRVKERLIGATLLVALIVLIVPELLSGPRQPSAPPLTSGMPASTRSLVVDLTTNTSTAQPDSAEASVATTPGAAEAASDAGSDETSAAASGASTSDGASAAQPPPEAGASPSVPTVTTLQAQGPARAPSGEPAASGDFATASTLETPPSAPKSTGGASASTQGHRGWAVQLGSFASRTNAERLIHHLQARGGSSLYVSASGSGASLRYRVRMGPLADRGAAERAAGKLKAAGHPSTLVAPNS